MCDDNTSKFTHPMDDAIFATLPGQVSQQTEVIIYMHDDAILPGNYSSNDAILQPSHQMTWHEYDCI